MNLLQKALVGTAAGLVRAAGFGEQSVPQGFGRAPLNLGDSRVQPRSIITTPESFAKYSWPYVGTSAIAEAVGTPPFGVFSRSGFGDDYELVDPGLNGVAQLFRPNEWCSPSQLMEATSGWLSLTGNAYWLLVPNELGGLAEIWPLDSRTVQVVPGRDTFIDGFLVRPRDSRGTTGELAFTADEVVHFKLFNPLDPYYGLTPLEATLRAIEAGIGGEDYNLRFFLNDATPGGFLTREADPTQGGGPVSEDEAKRIRAIWRSAFGNGTSKRFRTAALWGGWRYEQVAADHKDIAFAELDEKTQDKVLAVLGVPPAIAGQYRNLNFATAQVQKRAFWTDTVVPMHNRIGDILRMQYLPLFGGLNGWDFETDPFAAVVRWDYADVGALTDAILEQEQAYDIGIKNGSRTINEVRADRGDEAVPWGDGWWGPLNQVQLAGANGGAAAMAIATALAKALGGNGSGKYLGERHEPADVIEAQVVRELVPADRWAEAKRVAIAEVLDDVAAGHTKLLPSLGDDTRRKIISKQFDALLAPHTASYLRQYNAALRKQAQRVLDNYAEWVKTNERAGEPDATKGPTIDGLAVEEIFNVTFEAEQLAEAMTPETLATEVAIAQASLDSIGLEQEIRITSQMREFAEARAELMGLSTASTTEQQLSIVIGNAQAAGDSVRELAKEIREKYAEISRGRAQVIARTETASAGNFGLTQGWAQSRVVLGKEWIWSQVERESHSGINGTTRLPNGVWVLSGTELQYPVDPAGAASETINCGCTMAPVLDADALNELGITANPIYKQVTLAQWKATAGAGDRHEA